MPFIADSSGMRIDGDVAITEMVHYFNDETEHGKLFINYPMVEAAKYLLSTPSTSDDLKTVKCKGPHCPNTDCPERSTCPPVKDFKSLAAKIAPHRQDMTKITWSEYSGCKNHFVNA